MTYPQFYMKWHPLACFSVNQVKAIYPQFNRFNYYNWQRSGYIVSLRQGWYAFADYLSQPDYAEYFAGQICAPSYISLHSALAYYGVIPEAVIELTSVTTLKPKRYTNPFGTYSYQTIKPSLFWGYEPKPMSDGKTYMMATAEKALLDLLYLYPQYNTEDDMKELRLDEDFMQDTFQTETFKAYTDRMQNKALLQRANTLLKSYSL